MTAPAFQRLAAAVLGWHQRAACRHADPGLFFGPDGENDDARRRRETRAGHICAGCPVRQPCDDYAMSQSQSFWGVWAGQDRNDRLDRKKGITRKRAADGGRGRPGHGCRRRRWYRR